MSQNILIISDATGDTAQKLLGAALRQFDAPDVLVDIHTRVRTEESIEEILERAADSDSLVLHSIVKVEHRSFLKALCGELQLIEIDTIGPLVNQLSLMLHSEAVAQPGRQHQVDANYFRRIEAVEFAVKNDDGQHPRNLAKADVVLVGISRTSKTPLSTYLAQRGLKVANVPLVMGIEPPSELFRIDQSRIFGLSIRSEALFRIRQARLHVLGMPADTTYGMREHISSELNYATQFFEANPHWPVIDVTDRAIEETAAELLSLIREQARGD